MQRALLLLQAKSMSIIFSWSKAMTEKRKKIETLILETVKRMEPEGTNYERYKKKFNSMSDAEFESYMKELRDGKRKLTFIAPNMKVVLKTKNLMDAADYIGAEVFSRVTYTDPSTGIKYTSPYKQLILHIPIKRTRQFLHHGLSVPEGDTKFDLLTGQVVKPDQASKLSFTEAQLLHTRNMKNTITEFMKIRGGDINAYASFRQQLEETGTAMQAGLDPNTVNRTAMMTSLMLKCMGFDNNLVETAGDNDIEQLKSRGIPA